MASPTINWANAQKHKEKVVTKGANGIDFLMKKNKITVVKGHGRIAGKGKVEVTAEDGSKQTLDTKNIIIATGSVPKSLPNVQVDHKRVMNSDSILLIDRIPKSIIVLGAGAVGCEFASVFNHVGSQTSPSSSTCPTCCPSRTWTPRRSWRSTSRSARSTCTPAPRWRRWSTPPPA